jgi:protein-L-isoaspartate(D-aspartate) O-methyltransferase
MGKTTLNELVLRDHLATFIVALLTDLLEISADSHVLEIGTGLGYQAAILAAQLAQKVNGKRLLKSSGNKQRNDCDAKVALTSSSRLRRLSWRARVCPI